MRTEFVGHWKLPVQAFTGALVGGLTGALVGDLVGGLVGGLMGAFVGALAVGPLQGMQTPFTRLKPGLQVSLTSGTHCPYSFL
jgi:outer membrane lipoprotein SlyB